MQAVPVPDAAAASSFPNLIPGPFILLLALPAIPLLLFSIGARPPDTSNLPFSTDDLWQTTAAITVAGAVVLCLGFWPGAFSGIGNWVTEGAVDGGGFVQRLRGFEPRQESQVVVEQVKSVPRQGWPPQHPPGTVAPPQGRPKIADPGWQQARPAIAPRYPNVPSRYHPRPGLPLPLPMGDSLHPLIVIADIVPEPLYPSFAAKHLAYLREGFLSPWYSPSPPNFTIALLLILFTIGFLIVVMGHIIRDGYDASSKSRSKSESSPSSSQTEWRDKEVKKRKEEKGKPEVTAKRFEEDKKRWEEKLGKMTEAERRKEMKIRRGEEQRLIANLRKVDLPLIGLPGGGSEGKSKKKGKGGEKGKGKEQGNRDGKKNEEGGKEGGKKTFGSKIKRVFLGRQLADALDRKKAEERGETTATVSTKSMAKVKTEGGPGWKAADEAVAHAAVASGAVRAEAMGNKMVAEKASS